MTRAVCGTLNMNSEHEHGGPLVGIGCGCGGGRKAGGWKERVTRVFVAVVVFVVAMVVISGRQGVPRCLLVPIPVVAGKENRKTNWLVQWLVNQGSRPIPVGHLAPR